MNLHSLITRLDQDFEAIANAALSRSAEGLADTVRTALSTLPGGSHDHPWLQTGALHDSVGSNSCGSDAIVGSTSQIASHQEYGTTELPPRPTFAPLAAAEGEAIAHSIASAVAQALRIL